jgi:dienelactone hydrolase
VTLAGARTEVFYPARLGAERGLGRKRFDLREFMPAAEAAKVSDADNTYQACDCFDGLAIDDRNGPYPAIVFFHGAASYPTQSASFATHWASRGFVVIAPTLPQVGLRDALGERTPGDPYKVATGAVAAVRDGDPALDFLAGRLQPRLAVAGHSLGSGVAWGLRDEAGVGAVVLFTPGGAGAMKHAAPLILFGGKDDQVIPWSRQERAFAQATATGTAATGVFLVGLERAGHVAFSDICAIGRDRGGMLKIAIDHGVKVPPILASLGRDGCGAKALPAEEGWAVVNLASTAVLEEALWCRAGLAEPIIAGLAERFPGVATGEAWAGPSPGPSPAGIPSQRP